MSKRTYSLEDRMDKQIYILDDTGTPMPLVYSKTNEPVTLRSEYEFLDEKLRHERLKNARRKHAFSHKELFYLHQDRNNGMSIRELARKYNKSTATIQKYLKQEPLTSRTTN